jgi:hypothetical protein
MGEADAAVALPRESVAVGCLDPAFYCTWNALGTRVAGVGQIDLLGAAVLSDDSARSSWDALLDSSSWASDKGQA